MPADFHYLSLDEVARRLKARKLSSVEATQAMLDRIDKLDPKLKSYATLTPERALADAARLDAETAAGKSRGPLHGVPIAVKDLCNTEGVPTAAGMAIQRGHVPAKDATVVARLKAGGRGDPGQAADDRGRLRRASSVGRSARSIRGTPPTGPASRPRARAWRPRRAYASPRWAPTPAARSAFPRP